MSYQSGTNKIFYKKNLSWTNDFVKSNIDKIERNYKKHPTRNRWNCNCHVIHDDDLDVEYINFDYLRKKYEKIVKNVTKKYNIEKYHLSDIWYNYYKKGQYQEVHTHAGNGGVTAVHYLLFNNKEHSHTHFIDKNIKSPKIKQGDILFFPCDLQHYVPENETTVPRLTTAFTITKH